MSCLSAKEQPIFYMLTPSSPTIAYDHYSKLLTKKNIVCNTMKHLVVQMHFLTVHAQEGDVVILHEGNNPDREDVQHLSKLIQLFEHLHLEWHIYGQAQAFASTLAAEKQSAPKNVTFHQDFQFAKDQVLGGTHKPNSRMLFISNIHSLDYQKEWLDAIEPVAANLKLQVMCSSVLSSSSVLGSSENESSMFEYVDGELYMQPFSSQNSTELRLVAVPGSKMHFNTKEYSYKQLEENAAFFQRMVRPKSNFDKVCMNNVVEQYVNRYNLSSEDAVTLHSGMAQYLEECLRKPVSSKLCPMPIKTKHDEENEKVNHWVLKGLSQEQKDRLHRGPCFEKVTAIPVLMGAADFLLDVAKSVGLGIGGSDISVLDGMCGTGISSLVFSLFFGKVHAADYLPQQLDAARYNITKVFNLANDANVTVDEQPINLLDRKDLGTYDIVVLDPNWGDNYHEECKPGEYRLLVRGEAFEVDRWDDVWTTTQSLHTKSEKEHAVPLESIAAGILLPKNSQTKTKIVFLHVPSVYDFEYMRSEFKKKGLEMKVYDPTITTPACNVSYGFLGKFVGKEKGSQAREDLIHEFSKEYKELSHYYQYSGEDRFVAVYKAETL